MESVNLIPQYKVCPICQNLMTEVKIISEIQYFTCHSCFQLTKWNASTILENAKISTLTIEKLLILFLDNKTAYEAHNVLKYNFVNDRLNLKTVYRYFELFNTIVHDYVSLKMQSMMLVGEVELDETHLFKEKKSKAPSRQYKNSSQWLFGMRQRGTSAFIVIPIRERDKGTLELLILKHIKISSKIYSDCYSVYVNNRVTPKTSNLQKYGYIHAFVNHRVEFVSAMFNTIHTNTIESLWKEIKNFLRKTRCTSKFLFSIYRYYFTKELSKTMQFEILIKYLHKENHF